MAARLISLLLVLVLVAPAIGVSEQSRLAVIVHPARRTRVDLDDIAQIYLRRRRFWESGDAIVPLNLPAGTPLRAFFSRVVLRQEDARLGDYWNRQYFYGILPPATLASTEAMKRYVASDPNAIGYVRASEVDASVQVLLFLD